MSTSKKKPNHRNTTPPRKTSTSSATGKKKLTAAQRKELERQQRITQALIIVGSIVVAVIFIIVFLSLYDNNSTKDLTSGTSDSSGNSSVSSVDNTVYPASEEYEIAPDGEQLKKPAKGEEVAVLETSMGTIKIRLFPKYAPTAVENFKKLIQEGYYNGIIFHRVMNDFMIQGGDPTGTGTGGKCAFEGYETFGDEFGRNLYNLRGAVSMANTGAPGSNSSQFFIVQTKKAQYYTLGDKEGFLSNGGAKWAAEQYEKRGGTAYLDGQFKSVTGSGHTVFGQVYEGLKVVDKIAAVEVDGSNKPLTDVVIKKAYLTKVK
ncbi:MAG: peptidylprolyl isomerase [Clostridia bacterium]|nr:peptidylprolyl isomerase [Clostridia bacterium]